MDSICDRVAWCNSAIRDALEKKSKGTVIALLFAENHLADFQKFCGGKKEELLTYLLHLPFPESLNEIIKQYTELVCLYPAPNVCEPKFLDVLYLLLCMVLEANNDIDGYFLPLFRVLSKFSSTKLVEFRSNSTKNGFQLYNQAVFHMNMFHRKLLSASLKSLRRNNIHSRRVETNSPVLKYEKDFDFQSHALSICNATMKFCNKTGELQLLKKLSEQFSMTNTNLIKYPISDVVTFEFLVGSYELSLGKLSSAEKRLGFAYKHCHKCAYRNSHKIFLRLFVARWMHGVLPSGALLNKYGYLNLLSPLLNAFIKGNIAEFERIHNAQCKIWSKIGTYWIMKQKLRALLHRNLFKRVFLLCRLGDPNRTQIELSILKTALAFASNDKRCANNALGAVLSLVHSGYFRAYMLPGPQIINASKINAFPLNTHIVSTERHTTNKGLFRGINGD